jgi:hypothetical protein
MDGWEPISIEICGAEQFPVAPWAHLTGAGIEQAMEQGGAGFSAQNNAAVTRKLTTVVLDGGGDQRRAHDSGTTPRSFGRGGSSRR